MKAKDLILKLQTLNPEATVIVRTDNFEIGNKDVAVSMVYQYDFGKKKAEHFVDVFDHTNYTQVVWSIIEGTEPVILLR